MKDEIKEEMIRLFLAGEEWNSIVLKLQIPEPYLFLVLRNSLTTFGACIPRERYEYLKDLTNNKI